MMNVFNLPLEVISEAVLPLLKWKDIARLNASIKNHELRVLWLDSLSLFRIDPASLGYTVNTDACRALKWWCDKMTWFDNSTLNLGTYSRMLQSFFNSKYDWKRISKLALYDTQTDDSTLCQFLSCLTNVRTVVLDTENATSARTLIQSANKLKMVDLIGCGPDDSLMHLLGERHPDLHRLRLIRCDNITAFSTVAYLKNAHCLRDFACINTSNVTVDILCALGTLSAHAKIVSVATRRD